ncbi:ABC transporter permease [Mucilaginibacter sp.]|uniref:ABC transporter permease n=1 Tax=Mucilaginibacter sp. TaxID=1882438 RepID=UPI00374D605D
MFKNYLKIAWRNLGKNKGYTFVNIAGLGIAFACSILIFLFCFFQLSFDNFHADGDRIFQPYLNFSTKEGIKKSGGMSFPFTPNLKAEYPEVEKAARIINLAGVVRYKDKVYESFVNGTDEDLLDIFTFPLITGSKSAALNGLSNIIITEATAKKIFVTEDPMDKTIQVQIDHQWQNFIVTGVLKDYPENSSIRFESFVRIENAPGYASLQNNWSAYNHYAYLKLKPSVTASAFQNKAQPFFEKYFKTTAEDAKKEGVAPDKNGHYTSLGLLPLTQIHFATDILGDSAAKALIYTMMSIALVILLIASFNFINLSIALSITRAKEMGVRKSLGAQKKQVFYQLFGESFLVFFMGWLIGIIAAAVLLIQAATIFKINLSLAFIFQTQIITLQLAGFFFITLLAGGYPAWSVSRFNAVEILKGKISLKRPGILRNTIIITQFTIACLLICCTIIVVQQTAYLRKIPLGFNKEQIISIPVTNEDNGNQVLQKFRQALANHTGIVSVTGSDINIGKGLDNRTSRATIGFEYNGKNVSTDWLRVDFDYLKTLDIPLLAGRDFSRLYSTDAAEAVIINQSMADAMGEKNAVGKFLWPDSSRPKLQVIGVIPDFHLYSLKNKMAPVTLNIFQQSNLNYIFVKVLPQNMESSMNLIKDLYKDIAPNSVFKASFMDLNVDKWFTEDQMVGKVIGVSSFVAILLSCMGLFAIAWLIIQQRTKEIRVRKVLGAGISSVLLLLSKDYLKLVLVAIIIASIGAWFLMNAWLKTFPYKINIEWWVFALMAILAITIAVLTVGYQSIRAALMNPVKSLRSE